MAPACGHWGELILSAQSDNQNIHYKALKSKPLKDHTTSHPIPSQNGLTLVDVK